VCWAPFIILQFTNTVVSPSSLGDRDDDVRSVAASCLLPVAGLIVEQLPECLEQILIVLWHCLCDMKDDLSSSVGIVMDLLGILILTTYCLIFISLIRKTCYLRQRY
jgi:TATA-binding protein-associated factor